MPYMAIFNIKILLISTIKALVIQIHLLQKPLKQCINKWCDCRALGKN